MFPYDYALEKFGAAVRHLAIGTGDVRSRLWTAYLDLDVLRAGHLPEDLRADYEWVNRELTKREPQRKVWSESEQDWVLEGRVLANLRRMRNSSGAKIAERIYSINLSLETRHEEWADSLHYSGGKGE